MITVEEASSLIHQYLPNWGVVSESIETSFSFTTAEPIHSDRQYPPIDRVMMDGIAIDYDAYQKGLREFAVLGTCPAGEKPQQLKLPTGCFEVMTGAPLPENTSLVIPYEHLKIEQDVAKIITETERMRFENIHLKGSDIKPDQVVVTSGERFNGPLAGIAASMGLSSLKANKKPRVMLISTGDELVPINQSPLEYQLRRSNVYALKASLLNFGYQDVKLDHLEDKKNIIAAHFEKHAQEFDLMIYSGGVSKGKFDYLPFIWKDLGVAEHFHEVSQRPGKPLWFGTDSKRKTAILGLPGNPVSSLVCLHRYFLTQQKIYAKLGEEVIFKKDLTYFLPVKIQFETNGSITAHPLKIKNSGEFTALAYSDGFIELPKNQSTFAKGEAFAFYPWRGLC
jgi:molybdopterin molybdotransferase